MPHHPSHQSHDRKGCRHNSYKPKKALPKALYSQAQMHVTPKPLLLSKAPAPAKNPEDLDLVAQLLYPLVILRQIRAR